MNAEELCNELARALLAADEDRKRHIIAALVTKNGRALVNELLHTLKVYKEGK